MAALEEIGVDVFAQVVFVTGETLFQVLHVKVPEVDAQVSPATGHDVLPVTSGRHVRDLLGMGHQTDGVVGVAVEGQLDDADHLVHRGVR